MAKIQATKEIADQVFEAVELAKATGSIKKGTNEVTKALEKGTAKLVVIAKDVTPPEITMHLPLLSDEKKVLCVEVTSKDDLGAAAGLEVGTAAVAVTQEGDAKKVIKALIDQFAK
ncbi:50S ribosomal protein L7ae [Candidatus Woesearchaeota archaeon]|nr:50S ribosomal protein L7ae [Candidatus Woesearchaeota archaeon]